MTPAIVVAAALLWSAPSDAARPDFSGVYTESAAGCTAAIARTGTTAPAMYISHRRDTMVVRVAPQQATRMMRIARGESLRTASGIARGRLLHWEGDDLVVVSPASIPALWAPALPARLDDRALVVVERFSLASDVLTYTATYVGEEATLGTDTLRLPRCDARPN